MRIVSSVAMTIQQGQAKDRSEEIRNHERNVEANRSKHESLGRTSERNNRIVDLKESIKNGSYKIDLFATSEKMAQNLLNV